MTTQNLVSSLSDSPDPPDEQNTGPLRSSGHKDATEDHATVAQMATSGENANPEALLQNRVLNNDNVGRAAMYDEADFLCVASSTKQFKVEPDEVRKVLDGLLTYSRVGDPTFAHGDGPPPKHLNLGKEGTVNVKDGDQDKIVGELNGKASGLSLASRSETDEKVFVAGRTAKFVVFIEGSDSGNEAALATVMHSFQSGLQPLTL